MDATELSRSANASPAPDNLDRPVLDQSNEIVAKNREAYPPGTRLDALLPEDRLRILAETSSLVSDAGLDLRAILETLCRRTAELVGDCAALLLIADDGETLQPSTVFDPDKDRGVASWAMLGSTPARVGSGIHGKVVQTGEAMLVAETSPEKLKLVLRPDQHAYLDRVPIYSILVVPLRTRGRVFGSLGVNRHTPNRPYSHNDLQLVQELADRAALAIENARLFEREQEARRTAEQAVAELRDREMELRLALEAGRMGVWDWDVQNKQLRWTEQLEPLHGMVPGTFDGTFEAYLAAIDPKDRERVQNEIRLALEVGGDFWTEFRVPYPDGSQHWIAGTGRAFRDDNGAPVRMIGLGLDITERKRSEDAQSLLADAALLLAEAHLDQVALLDALCRSTVASLGDQATIQLVAADGKTIDVVAVNDIDPEIEKLRREMLVEHPSRVGEGLIGTVVQSGVSLLIPLVDPVAVRAVLMPGHVPYFDRAPIKSLVAVPMHVGGKVVGALSLARRSNVPFDERDMILLQELANRAALAIENSRLFVAEREARTAAEAARNRAVALAETSRQLVEASLDAAEILDIVGRRAVSLVGDGSTIALLKPNGTAFEVPSIHHSNPEALSLARELLGQFPPHRHGSLADQVLATGESIVIPDIRPEVFKTIVRPGQTSYASKFGFSSLAILPLRARGRSIGVLSVWRDRPGRPYSDDDLRVLRELANRAASAIDNARLYDESRAAIRSRDEFLATAAHELKTPVTGLRLNAQLLLRVADRDGQVEPERLRRMLGIIDQQSVKLAVLVAQLLDVARLDGGKLILEKQVTDIIRVVAEVVTSAETRIGRRQIDVVAPTTVIASVDALRLEQVITNLLDNALKFSPEATRVEVAIGEAYNEITIGVTDHGIGIPPERRSVIFDRFSQAHADAYLSGLGLGLYISRQITELHGGTLVAEFPEDGGTRFLVRLPRGQTTTEHFV